MTQHCGEEAPGALQAQNTALGLFQIAALMLGNEEEAVSLVEQTLASVEADPCIDAAAVDDQARPRLVEGAVRHMAKLDPAAFAVPAPAETTAACIDTDDLSAVGLSGEQLGALTQGPGRAKMKEWLEQLTPALRAIFVLRAVVGQDGEKTAENLRRGGAAGWKKEQVGTAYRQALCSLATSLLISNSVVAPV